MLQNEYKILNQILFKINYSPISTISTFVFYLQLPYLLTFTIFIYTNFFLLIFFYFNKNLLLLLVNY